MQQSLINSKDSAVLHDIIYLVGNVARIVSMPSVPARKPFDDEMIDFLNAFSRNILKSQEAKEYADIITLGFWTRKSSLINLKERFVENNGSIHLGRGIAFHIAPSNVPVNYAYSLVTGLITGNANIVRIPSKDFPQITIINEVISQTLEEFEGIKPYLCLVKYSRNQKINDYLSAIADTRIIWGGDQTIAELRKSPLGPRAGEVTFADRYSLAIIDSDRYLASENKEHAAEGFYNDTFLTDQNACTSPRIVVWTGKQKEKAKTIFWEHERKLVKSKYTFQPIMGVNKLTSSYLAAVALEHIKIEAAEDNYIMRVAVDRVDSQLMDFRDNAGYFYEYDCDDILDLRCFCDNTRCQTIGYLGNIEDLIPLIESGIKGVDRIVPMGKTMDFDFIWDGYNLVEKLTRTIKLIL